MIDLLLLLVAIGSTTKRVNTGNTIGRVASVIINADHSNTKFRQIATSSMRPAPVRTTNLGCQYQKEEASWLRKQLSLSLVCSSHRWRLRRLHRSAGITAHRLQ